MSHEKVKQVKIENGEVLVFSKCNNDTEPPRWWNCTMLTEILNEEGQEAAELSIFKAFECYNFQSADSIDNKYTRALRALEEMPEYAAFDWHRKYRGDNEQDNAIEQARNSAAFDELLKKALNTKLQKDNLIVVKNWGGITYYLKRVTSRGLKWSGISKDAKVFKYAQDIKKLAATFDDSNKWILKTV